MLFTVPGTPSVYYGSEYGIEGKKEHHSDAPLRPCWDNISIPEKGEELFEHIADLSKIRKASKSLKYGDFKQVHLENQCFAFSRSYQGETTVVAVNIADSAKKLNLNINSKNIELELDAFGSKIINL